MAPRIVGTFFLKLVAIYALLAAPWPGVRDVYGSLYRAVGTAVFGEFGSRGIVVLREARGARSGLDTEIAIRSRRSPVVGTTPHSSRMTGYLPTAEVLALILATPVVWRRRLKALVWGLVAIHGFIWLRLEILLLYFFSRDTPWRIHDPGPFWSGAVEVLFEGVVVSPTLSFIVPVFIWILSVFRRRDLDRLAAFPAKRPGAA